MTLGFTILLLFVVAGLILLLGLGIAIALGVLVVGGVLIALFFVVFGHGLAWMGIGLNNQAKAIPQQFNQCLLGDDLELCRTKFTVWKPEEAETIKQLAAQVRNDLGARREDPTAARQYDQASINGKTTVTIDEDTDFDKRERVREHYVLVLEGKDKFLKIKELKWDYGQPTPVSVPASHPAPVPTPLPNPAPVPAPVPVSDPVPLSDPAPVSDPAPIPDQAPIPDPAIDPAPAP